MCQILSNSSRTLAATGVQYLLEPGAKLSFGKESNQFTVEYEPRESNTVAMEMLFKGMAANASQEVQEKLDL